MTLIKQKKKKVLKINRPGDIKVPRVRKKIIMFFILSVFSGTETKHRISEKTVEQLKEIGLSETKKTTLRE